MNRKFTRHPDIVHSLLQMHQHDCNKCEKQLEEAIHMQQLAAASTPELAAIRSICLITLQHTCSLVCSSWDGIHMQQLAATSTAPDFPTAAAMQQKQQATHLQLGWQQLEDVVNLVLEAAGEHLIGLVQHKHLDAVGAQAAAAQHVKHAAGGAHHHVHTCK
jgi:hypothetical protein